MKHKQNIAGDYTGCLLWIVIIFTCFAFSCCCRPATAHQVQKWEQRHKFESPGGFWGLHIFQKKNVYKYK